MINTMDETKKEEITWDEIDRRQLIHIKQISNRKLIAWMNKDGFIIDIASGIPIPYYFPTLILRCKNSVNRKFTKEDKFIIPKCFDWKTGDKKTRQALSFKKTELGYIVSEYSYEIASLEKLKTELIKNSALLACAFNDGIFNF